MLHTPCRRPISLSFALLAWLLNAVTAHSHGHRQVPVPAGSGGQLAGAAIDLDRAQHDSSLALVSGSHGAARAEVRTTSAASTMLASLDGVARQRRRLLHSDSENERDATAAVSMELQLAAAAKADIAAKHLRARKAGMYPGSPARRALAEDPNQAVRTCGTPEPSATELRAVYRQLAARATALGAEASRVTAVNSTLHISVHFHVITSSAGNSSDDGYVADATVAAQIAVMNSAYGPAGVQFNLASTDRTVNATWYKIMQGTQTEVDMKSRLHKGGPMDLNLYSCNPPTSMPDEALLGYSTFPWNYVNEPKLDGVVLNVGALPGGAFPLYSIGQTATHEVGHWLGLYHPFQGGCTEPNDYIPDTPEEYFPSTGCVERNSCPFRPANQGNRDPIHNYMDYSPDACMNNFTPLQAARVAALWQLYRVAAADSEGVPKGPTPASPLEGGQAGPSEVTSPLPTPTPKPKPTPKPVPKPHPKPTPKTTSADPPACVVQDLLARPQLSKGSKSKRTCIIPASKGRLVFLLKYHQHTAVPQIVASSLQLTGFGPVTSTAAFSYNRGTGALTVTFSPASVAHRSINFLRGHGLKLVGKSESRQDGRPVCIVSRPQICR